MPIPEEFIDIAKPDHRNNGENQWVAKARREIEGFETLLSPEEEKRFIRILTSTVCNAFLDGVEKGKVLKIEQIKEALRI